MWLKQSTTVTIRLGPALDKTDGVTEETALSPTVEVSKNHGAFAARNSATAITHDSNGWYAVELNTTDTGTLGPLIVKFDSAADHLPVWREFVVLPAHVYDGLVAGTDNLQVDTVQWLGTACATPTVAGVPEVDPTHWLGTALATPDTAGYPKATIKDGTGTGELDTNAGKVALTDAAVDTIWDEVLSSTFHNTSQTAGQRLRLASAMGADGKVNDAAATTTSFVTDLASAVNDFYNDQVIVFTTGALAGQCRVILDYVGATKTITVDEALTSAPADTVEFVVIAVHVHPVGQIADGVWDEALAGHAGAGSAGEALTDAATDEALDAAAIRAAVGLASANLDTQIGDLPTNAELATALAGADDATLAAIAALNNLSSAQAQTAAAAALTAYDPPTHAEMTAELATADDVVLAAITALNDLSAVEVENAVWDAVLADHPDAGSTGEALHTASDHNAAGIAAAVWDEPLAGHLDAGSTGEALDGAGGGGGGPSAAAIADAVWDEAMADHAGAGTTGEAMGTVLSLPSHAEIAQAVWELVVEDGGAEGPVSAEMVQRAILAYFAGVVTGGGTDQIVYLSRDGGRVRIQQNDVDEFGNRGSVDLDLDV